MFDDLVFLAGEMWFAYINAFLFVVSLAACLFVVSWFLVRQLCPCFHLSFRTAGSASVGASEKLLRVGFELASGRKLDIEVH